MSAPLSEDDLIASFFAPAAGPGALGLKDDAALVGAPEGCEIVVTVDALVAGVHFLAADPPASIARKALRVNLSDLAAKGADPLGFVLAAAFPPGVESAWVGEFAQALGADARAYDCQLLGGDTVRTPGPMTLSITALGSVPKGRMVARTGARAGDALYVSGTIGDGALGLLVHAPAAAPPLWAGGIGQGACEALRARFLEPLPRLLLREPLRAHASGAMDVSDGLVGDLAKMMRASGTGARVELARIPLSDAARSAIGCEPALLDVAVTGGDDYEILCSVPPARAASFEAAAMAAGVPVTRIGEVNDDAQAGACFLDAQGARKTFARGSYSHF